MTRTTPFRRTTRQCLQICLTEAPTFILRNLSLSVGNQSLVQIVRRDLQFYAIALDDSDVMHSHFSGKPRPDWMIFESFGRQFDEKLPSWVSHVHDAFELDFIIFFGHSGETNIAKKPSDFSFKELFVNFFSRLFFTQKTAAKLTTLFLF
jgi:hypothetical protein